MAQKLFDLANDKCAIETPDNPMLQEVLLGGHLYQIVLKVCIYFSCYPNFISSFVILRCTF